MPLKLQFNAVGRGVILGGSGGLRMQVKNPFTL